MKMKELNLTEKDVLLEEISPSAEKVTVKVRRWQKYGGAHGTSKKKTLRTEFLKFYPSLFHISLQLGPFCELVLCTSIQEFGLCGK